MKTKENLAKAMEEAGCPPELCRKARSGYYDDYESPLVTPIVQLVSDLRAIGQVVLARRAQLGEFDGTKEEAEAWFAREGKLLL